MFSWEVFNDTTPFTELEDKVVKAYLKILMKECPRDAAFLNMLDIDQVHFLWANKMNSENGVLGAWSLMHADNVYMAPISEMNRSSMDFQIKRTSEKTGASIENLQVLANMDHLFSEGQACTLIHELNHKFQFKVSPVLFIINRLVTLLADRIPYAERIGIEYDSRKYSETEELTKFYQAFHTTFDYMVNSLNVCKPLNDDNTPWRAYMDMHSDDYDGFTSVEGLDSAAEVRKYHKLVAPVFNMIIPDFMV